MKKAIRYTLLFLLLLAYMLVASFEILFGTLQLPFLWLADKIIKQANKINTSI